VSFNRLPFSEEADRCYEAFTKNLPQVHLFSGAT
jgi:hypothetical protein